jgi:hypothetical protein
MMDGRVFDELTKATGNPNSRRGALGLMAGAALTAAIARISPVAAKKHHGKGKKKKCRKLGLVCGGKKKRCCKGFTCADGTCQCPSGTIPENGKCVPPEPECQNNGDCSPPEICQDGLCVAVEAECENNGDCDFGEVCDDGVCVEAECLSDNDCRDNEECQDGECICPGVLEGRCVVTCDEQADCPGACQCLGTFPGDGQPRVVCVSEPFLLCSDATPCNSSDDCDTDEICSFTDCDSPEGSGRCFQVCVR